MNKLFIVLSILIFELLNPLKLFSQEDSTNSKWCYDSVKSGFDSVYVDDIAMRYKIIDYIESTNQNILRIILPDLDPRNKNKSIKKIIKVLPIKSGYYEITASRTCYGLIIHYLSQELPPELKKVYKKDIIGVFEIKK